MNDRAKGLSPDQKVPKPREITLPPRTYQPSRAELREEFDMPGASMETVRRAFFRPVKVNPVKG
jgi:hypothetical protein